MSIAGYRLGIRLFTLFGLLSLLVFIFEMDPESLSQWGMAFFFVSLWGVATGLFLLFLLFLYEKAIGGESTVLFLGSVFRQAILLGTLTLGLLILQYLRIFAWWNALLLTAFFLLLEFTFRTFSSKK